MYPRGDVSSGASLLRPAALCQDSSLRSGRCRIWRLSELDETATRSGLRHRHIATAGALLVLVLASACSREAPAPSPASAPASAPAPSPAPASTGPKLYVSDETGGAVIVIDTANNQVLERIAVGKRPRGILASRMTEARFSSRSPDHLSPARVSTSRSCHPQIARLTESAWSISPRESWCARFRAARTRKPSIDRPTAKRFTFPTRKRPRCQSSILPAAPFASASRSARSPKA